MTSSTNQRRLASLAGGAFVLVCVPLWACSVPVFRYALERWSADPYELSLYYRGELSTDQRVLVDRLQSTEFGRVANVQWRMVDVDGDHEGDSNTGLHGRMLDPWKSRQLPWIVVRSPATQTEIWSGSLTSPAIEEMFDSPMRQEIVRRLLTGQTAVWVLLDGVPNDFTEEAEGRVQAGNTQAGNTQAGNTQAGNTQAGNTQTGNTQTGSVKADNEAAFTLLMQRLAEEQAKLELPEIEEADIQNGLVDIDPQELKIEFSALRLTREDAQERTFRKMLLATEDDLHEFQQPMAFPIFGRGRVLYALVGEGINAENIHAACKELTGPCTCQVKAQNLGADLLMSVAWAELIRPTAEAEKRLPPLAGLAGLSESLEELGERSGEMGESSGAMGKPLGIESDTGQVSNQSAIADTPVAAYQVSTPNPPTVDPQMGSDSKLEAALPRLSDTGASETGPSPLMVGMMILLGLGVIGIAGASWMIVRR